MQVSLFPLTSYSRAHTEQHPLFQEFNLVDQSTKVWAIDLRAEEKQLWANLSENARRLVKKARAGGYTVRKSSFHESFNRIHATYGVMCARTGMENPSPAFFQAIMDVLEAAGHASVWVCLDKTERPVAYHVTTHFKDSAWYHLGCSETEHLNGGVNYLLAWTAVVAAKAANCLWYGLGEAADNAVGKAKSLSEFKRKMGAQQCPWFKGERTYHRPQAGIPGPKRLARWLNATTRYVAGLFQK